MLWWKMLAQLTRLTPPARFGQRRCACDMGGCTWKPWVPCFLAPVPQPKRLPQAVEVARQAMEYAEVNKVLSTEQSECLHACKKRGASLYLMSVGSVGVFVIHLSLSR